MKKEYVVFAVLLVLLFGFVSAISSDSINQQASSIDKSVQNINSQIDTTQKTLTNEEVRSAYLKKQWVTILENKPMLKQLISGYRPISPYTDPTLEYLIGIVPELSLFFVLVLVIWFFLVKYFSTIYEVLKDLDIFSKSIALVISFSFFIILTVVQFFQNISLFLANKVVALTELMDSTIFKVAAFVIFVVVVIFLSKFSKEIKVLARYLRMKNAKRKKEAEEAERNTRQERATEKVETYVKAMTED